MVRIVLLDVPPAIHSPRKSYPRWLPEMCTWTLAMLLLQLEQVAVEWPEVGSQLSFRPAEMEMPSTLRSKLPLTLLKGDKEKRLGTSRTPLPFELLANVRR